MEHSTTIESVESFKQTQFVVAWQHDVLDTCENGYVAVTRQSAPALGMSWVVDLRPATSEEIA